MQDSHHFCVYCHSLLHPLPPFFAFFCQAFTACYLEVCKRLSNSILFKLSNHFRVRTVYNYLRFICDIMQGLILLFIRTKIFPFCCPNKGFPLYISELLNNTIFLRWKYFPEWFLLRAEFMNSDATSKWLIMLKSDRCCQTILWNNLGFSVLAFVAFPG